VQRELFYCKIKYALCAVPATVKGRSVARYTRPCLIFTTIYQHFNTQPKVQK